MFFFLKFVAATIVIPIGATFSSLTSKVKYYIAIKYMIFIFNLYLIATLTKLNIRITN